MKAWFSLSLFVTSVAYTAYGLHTLSLVDMSGRPGAGYFPLIVGVLLIAATSFNAVRDFRARRPAVAAAAAGQSEGEPAVDAATSPDGPPPTLSDGARRYGRDVFVTLCMLFVFILSLTVLGGLLSMTAFMLMFLFYFNRTKMVTNIVYSLALPLFLYWLFKIMLNASLPIGLLGF